MKGACHVTSKSEDSKEQQKQKAQNEQLKSNKAFNEEFSEAFNEAFNENQPDQMTAHNKKLAGPNRPAT